MGVSLLQGSDIRNIHPFRRMIIGNRHTLKRSNRLRRENLRLRPVNRNQRSSARQSQFLGQVFLGTGPGNRDIQAKQVSLRFPARDILGESGTVIVHIHFLSKQRHTKTPAESSVGVSLHANYLTEAPCKQVQNHAKACRPSDIYVTYCL